VTKKLVIFGGTPAFDDKIFVTRPVVPTMEELTPLLKEILTTKWLTNDGPYVQEFEKELRKYLGVPHCSTYCNGTLALQLCVQGLRLSGEVITTPFTFPATPHVLYWNNITPVFCDINPHSYNLDPQYIESLISPRTTGIMAVHIFGNPCDMELIEKIANYHGLKVIYDAAHAFGVEVNGKSIGNFGDASMFSFHATKIFNTLEGGAVACQDVNLYQRLRDLRNFGIRSEEEVISPGINAKMNEFQSVFGLLNLKKVNDGIKKRKNLFVKYLADLKNLPGLIFQKINDGTTYNYSYLTVEISSEEFGLNRDDVYFCMRKEGIMVRKYFFPLSSNYSCYQALPSAKKELLPTANRLASRILCLPLFEEMKNDDVDKIIEVLSLLHDNAPEIKKLMSCIQSELIQQ
jgi:dTDP-4-amino-4,6-dideoxygalactose transaminase